MSRSERTSARAAGDSVDPGSANERAIERIHRATGFVTFIAVVFCLFFQISKGGPFRDINPFIEDPYDAVGSISIQVAFLVGILTYSRALRLREAPSQPAKTRLIFHGNVVVALAILITLITDRSQNSPVRGRSHFGGKSCVSSRP